MNIALLTQDFPPFAYGGVASACSDLARSLLNEGVEVKVICGHAPRRNAPVTVCYENLRVTSLPSHGSAPRLSFALENMGRLTRLVAGADIIHSFGSFGFFMNSVRKAVRKPLVSNIHSIPHRVLRRYTSAPLSAWTPGDFGSDVLEYPLNELLLRQTLHSSDRVVVPSLHTLRGMRVMHNSSIEKCTVIPNGVDFEAPYFKSLPKALPHGGPTTIVYSGRLSWIKGISFLVDAFSLVARRTEKVLLKIIGWGPMGPRVVNHVSQLGLHSKVHFLGALDRERAIREIHDSAFLVLPSLDENGAVVACEAMGLRKPIVAFDYPFARELITKDHEGLLAKPQDVQDLSDKMLSLVVDENLVGRLGENAHRSAVKRFNWRVNVKRYLSLYMELAE